MAETFEKHLASGGVISGATDLEPAPTHALIYTLNEKVTEIQVYPPFNRKNSEPLRDMSLWFLHENTMYLLKNAPREEKNISPVLNLAIQNGAEYIIQKYPNNWYHFATSEDLEQQILFQEQL